MYPLGTGSEASFVRADALMEPARNRLKRSQLEYIIATKVCYY